MKVSMKGVVATLALTVAGLAVTPGIAAAAPADGRCVAQGAGFTFDGPTKASVARARLMSFVIQDHVFNNADGTETLLGATICP